MFSPEAEKIPALTAVEEQVVSEDLSKYFSHKEDRYLVYSLRDTPAGSVFDIDSQGLLSLILSR